MEELAKRVEKLERENRLLRVISFLVLLTLSTVFFMGANKWNKEIVTESLNIVDKKGNTRIKLSGDVEGTGISAITLYESEEEPRLQVSVFEGAPVIALYDSEKKTRLGMTVYEGEMPFFSLSDSEGEIRLSMGILGDGAPILEFCGADGRVIHSLP